uniref:Uncharacterized protein n=2 Tax=Picea TaxID=3328 RepID=A0A117NIS9_PICGL|nr:hypothetical protein ABT39_MTgene236 [Picea glauca]QHR90113.1 hypothetical protein Q903MT_gene4136 [Picea sitchensis]
MQGRIPNDASWCWKGIMQTRNLLSKGLCFSVRNGRSINIWEDQRYLSQTPIIFGLDLEMKDRDQNLRR